MDDCIPGMSYGAYRKPPAIPAYFALGLLRGESPWGIAASDYALAFVVGLFSLGFCIVLFGCANLMTRNLGITYATLPLALLWLALLREIHVERPLYLAAGAALIVATNLLVHFKARHHSRQDEPA